MAQEILDPVRVATTENITIASGVQIGVTTIDGVILTTGNRILVKAQTDKVQNGIYVVQSNGSLTRSTDFAAASSHTSTIVFVQAGNTLADTGFILTTDGSVTVGTTQLEFQRFTTNSKYAQDDVESLLVYRSEKGYPLSNDELDGNFRFLADSLTGKVNTSDYTAEDIASKLSTLTAAQLGLNAYYLRGLEPNTAVPAIPSGQSVRPETVAIRDNEGDLTALVFHGDLDGNASSATFATTAGTANSISSSYTIPIARGGTGATTAADARTNLNVVSKSGDTMSGLLSLSGATTGAASLNIPPSSNAPSSPADGDVWASSTNLFYRLNGVTKSVAPIEAPTFTSGAYLSGATAAITTNSTLLATTAFVQAVKNDLVNNSIALKADIASPNFTGTPKIGGVNIATLSDIPAIPDISVKANLASPNFSGTPTIASKAIATKEYVDSSISTVSAQIPSLTAYATIAYVDSQTPLWGTSRKFVSATAPASPANGDFWFQI